MQTDILLKQVTSSLAELKSAIEKFEKHPSPSTQYAGQLHLALNEANKLVSAYVVLKEQKDVSPELGLHLKIMNVQEVVSIKEEAKPVEVPAEPVAEKPLEKVQEPVIEKPLEQKPAEPIVEKQPVVLETPVVPQVSVKPAEIVTPQQMEIISKIYPSKELPKLAISINDKFRFINELFAANAGEYGIAIEQLNSLNTAEEAQAYLKGLKSIYNWDEEAEMVKKMNALVQKRFA